MIGILNYEMGNLQSVKNSLDYLGIISMFVNQPAEIDICDKIILPGVGAFGLAMDKLNQLGFAPKIKDCAIKQKPILGICLGMQLLLEGSEEYGYHEGLGLIEGQVLPFSAKVKNLPIPHVGWNEVKKEPQFPLFNNIDDNSCFYFVHSFYCQLTNPTVAIGRTDYGLNFTSVLSKDKIFGCQFHPEKSQMAGLQILKNFSTIV